MVCKYCHDKTHYIDTCPVIICKICRDVGHPKWLCPKQSSATPNNSYSASLKKTPLVSASGNLASSGNQNLYRFNSNNTNNSSNSNQPAKSTSNNSLSSLNSPNNQTSSKPSQIKNLNYYIKMIDEPWLS